MSEKIIVGRSLNKLKSSPKVRYSKIVVEVDKNTKYTAGDDSAGTLTVKIPWGTQTIADNLLKQYKGFEYQPYKAESGIVDPAAEIGDGITAGRVYGGLFQQDLTFGKIPKSNFSAPQQEQINHEYPYTPKRDREVNREIGGVKTSLKVQAGLISTEVEERKRLANTVSEHSTKISQNAEGITAEIIAREEAISGEAAARGELAGTVNGLGTTVSEHSTKISATSEALSAEVTAREALEGVVSGHTSTLLQQADLISAKVSTTGGDDSSFSWEMLSDGMSWYANSQLIFSLSESGGEFTGKVVAESGEIGGFTLENGYMHTGNGSWSHCEPGEIYFGPDGINFSENFYVDAQGNLTAYSGRFEGTVFASSIAYGGGASGYLNGGALTEGSVFGGVGGQLASNTITGGLSGNIDLETIIGGDGGNIAYETLSVGNVNAGFNSNLAQVYTNQDAIAANAVIVGTHGTQIGDLENRLNGTTEATNIRAALLGCSGTFTMPAGSHFNYRGHSVKWVQIDPKTYAMCYTV